MKVICILVDHGDVALDHGGIRLKLLHAVFERSSSVSSITEHAFKSVNLRLDSIDFDGEIRLSVLDASDLVLNVDRCDLDCVDISPDHDRVVFEIGQTSDEVLGIVAVVVDDTIEGVDLLLDTRHSHIEIVIVVHERGHIDLDVSGAHFELIHITLQLSDVSLAGGPGCVDGHDS